MFSAAMVTSNEVPIWPPIGLIDRSLGRGKQTDCALETAALPRASEQARISQ